MKKIILTAPTSFEIQYEINPWMKDNIGTTNKHVAVQQWNELRNALIEAGADVMVMPEPPRDCPDAVFTANAGLIFKNTFILSRFRHAVRSLEEPFFTKWFSEFYNVIDSHKIAPAEQLSFEGAGDALFSNDRKNLWMGFGFRSSLSYKPFLETDLEDAGCSSVVRPLQLVDPYFYHLDTCFCPLDNGMLLWYPPAFAEHSRYIIELWYKDRAIPVQEPDALRFACNAISIGNNLVTPKITPFLEQVLKDHGLTVFQVDMSQYQRSGGACKCLTLESVE